jgi:hypothetical protein
VLHFFLGIFCSFFPFLYLFNFATNPKASTLLTEIVSTDLLHSRKIFVQDEFDFVQIRWMSGSMYIC